MTWPEPEEGYGPAESLPLSGLRVLDLSRIVAGPFATMVLGDLGADVIKVERPGEGDEPRRWGPPFHGDMAAYFLAINRNRRSLAVDLTTDQGQSIVADLARSADVVLDNFLPMQAERLGIDRVKSESTAVWISIRAAGSDGPDGDKPGLDAAVQARSGLMSINGAPGGGPMKMGVPIVDILSGMYAAIAALAGLRQKSQDESPRFEIPLLECGVSALLNQAANYLVSGRTPGPSGNDHPNLAPYGPFPTADGQIFLAATSDLQFERLCRMLDLDELPRSSEFATNSDRVHNREALLTRISETTTTASTAEWFERARGSGALVAPVHDVAQALDQDPHITSVDLVQEVATTAGATRIVGSPILVDGRRLRIRSAPPEVGEHTEQILAALGHSREELRVWRELGVY